MIYFTFELFHSPERVPSSVLTPVIVCSAGWCDADVSALSCGCSHDVPTEYTGEEQAICVVGLVKPPSGVFSPATHYLLVVATVSTVTLLGVTTGPTNKGKTKPRCIEISYSRHLPERAIGTNV